VLDDVEDDDDVLVDELDDVDDEELDVELDVLVDDELDVLVLDVVVVESLHTCRHAAAPVPHPDIPLVLTQTSSSSQAESLAQPLRPNGPLAQIGFAELQRTYVQSSVVLVLPPMHMPVKLIPPAEPGHAPV